MALDTTLPIQTTIVDDEGNARPDALAYCIVFDTSDTNSDGEPDDIDGVEDIITKGADSNGVVEFTELDLPVTYPNGGTPEEKYLAIDSKAIDDGSGEPLDNGRFAVLDSTNESNASDYVAAYQLESTLPSGTEIHYEFVSDNTNAVVETQGVYSDSDFIVPNNASWVSNPSWWYDEYLELTSAADMEKGNGWGDFGSTTFSNEVCFIIEYSSSSNMIYFYSGTTKGGFFRIGTDGGTTTNSDDGGYIGLRYRDNDSGKNDFIMATDNKGYADGNRHFVAIQFKNFDPYTHEIYTDGNGFVPSSVNKSQSPAANDFTNLVLNEFDSGMNIGRFTVVNRMLSESELDQIATNLGYSPP
jgi:hypothetical protein